MDDESSGLMIGHESACGSLALCCREHFFRQRLSREKPAWSDSWQAENHFGTFHGTVVLIADLDYRHAYGTEFHIINSVLTLQDQDLQPRDKGCRLQLNRVWIGLCRQDG